VGRGGIIHNRRITCGIPQGSVLSPILWNVGYDSVLRVDLPPGCKVLGYADDTVVVVVGDSLVEVIQLTFVRRSWWGGIRQLFEVSPHKTEIMVFGEPFEWGCRWTAFWSLLGSSSDIWALCSIPDGRFGTVSVVFSHARTEWWLGRLMPNIGGA